MESKRNFRKRLTSNKGKFLNSKKRRLDQQHPLGGNSSDPLNLEEAPCPDFTTNSLLPSAKHRHIGDQPAPLPQQLHHDPLNLEGKIENFDSIVSEFSRQQSHQVGKTNKRKKRQRKKSHSESSSSESRTISAQQPSTSSSKAVVYRYGNYTQYYGYRNSGAYWDDPRLKLLKGEWFRGKECLDIGSNTGQVTIAIGEKFSPLKITGIDIDTKLVRMAWKNLNRCNVPMVTPSGQPFPKSLMMIHLPPPHKEKEKEGEKQGKEFPDNVEFKQVTT